MVSESRDLSIIRLVMANIVGVPRARWKVEGKEKKRERGRRRREAREASYVCGGPIRRLLANYASQKCQGSEHARMNIIQLVIRERTSLGWPHES